MDKSTTLPGDRALAGDCAITALLAVLIAVSGTFRIPGIVPGTEFQLSAPIAVAICGTSLARVAMYFLLGKGLTLMLIAAAPGMVFTAATAWIFGKILSRCRDAIG